MRGGALAWWCLKLQLAKTILEAPNYLCLFRLLCPFLGTNTSSELQLHQLEIELSRVREVAMVVLQMQ